MDNLDWFGTIITANVKFNRDVNFGDSTVDNNVYDIYTVVKHEIGADPSRMRPIKSVYFLGQEVRGRV